MLFPTRACTTAGSPGHCPHQDSCYPLLSRAHPASMTFSLCPASWHGLDLDAQGRLCPLRVGLCPLWVEEEGHQPPEGAFVRQTGLPLPSRLCKLVRARQTDGLSGRGRMCAPDGGCSQGRAEGEVGRVGPRVVGQPCPEHTAVTIESVLSPCGTDRRQVPQREPLVTPVPCPF